MREIFFCQNNSSNWSEAWTARLRCKQTLTSFFALSEILRYFAQCPFKSRWYTFYFKPFLKTTFFCRIYFVIHYAWLWSEENGKIMVVICTLRVSFSTSFSWLFLPPMPFWLPTQILILLIAHTFAAIQPKWDWWPKSAKKVYFSLFVNLESLLSSSSIA